MDNEQKAFMHSIIKQCSTFFLGLHKYCEEYAEKNIGADKNFSKKKKGGQGEKNGVSGSLSKAKKKKKEKSTDPNKPKKPLTPFFLYFKKRHEEIRTEFPNFNATDITEQVGKEWRNLSEKEQTFYKDEFSKNYNVYLTEKKLYEETKKAGEGEKKKVSPADKTPKKDSESATQEGDLGKRADFPGNSEEDDEADEEADEEDSKASDK